MFYKNFLINAGAAVPGLIRKCGSRVYSSTGIGQGALEDPAAAREGLGPSVTS